MRKFLSSPNRAMRELRFQGAVGTLTVACAIVGITSITNSAKAHHSFAAEFSYELRGTKEGEVVEVHYVNPHTRVFVAVVNEDGEEEIWDAQTHAISSLLRAGWLRDTVSVGDKLVLEGNLGLAGSRKLWINRMTLEDGEVFTLNAGN